MKNLDRLCIHTITTKPWSIEETLDQYCERGIGGISIWRETIKGKKTAAIQNRISGYPIELVSYVRGGFFAYSSATERNKSIENNKRMIEEAAELGAPLLVLVCGSDPKQDLSVSREQIKRGIEVILPFAENRKVKLGIEPLHPMYADTRSAVNTMSQANQLTIDFNSPFVGVVMDVYHVWWDPDLQTQIEICGNYEKLFGYHLCDWKVPTIELLHDREIMGRGCIPLGIIHSWVMNSGFSGFHEVEIFSTNYWFQNQSEFLNQIVDAYLAMTS